MFPFELLRSEASAANLLEKIRWREGLCCPRCQSESVIKHGSYREYQQYLCKDCDRTFNDKIGTISAHAEVGLDNRETESLTVYTDGFRAYDPLDDAENFQRESVIHGDGEYVDGDAHVNTCASHASLARRWLSTHRGVSKDKLTAYLRPFQLRRRILRKPGREALKEIVRAVL